MKSANDLTLDSFSPVGDINHKYFNSCLLHQSGDPATAHQNHTRITPESHPNHIRITSEVIHYLSSIVLMYSLSTIEYSLSHV